MKHSGIKRRLLCLVLAATMALPLTSAVASAAAEKELSLSQAISLTVKNSSKLRSITLSKIKKQIQLKQAYSAIADTRRNESTIRFSLLFNIRWPEEHGMPKEVELLTKVPDIQSEIKILNAKYNYTVLSETAKCEQQYYDVMYCNYEVDFYKAMLAEAEEAYNKILREYAAGNAKKSDIDYMKKQVKDAQNSLSKAQSAYEAAKSKLSKIIGRDVTKGYTFGSTLPAVNIDRSMLPSIENYALQNDFTYYEARENLNNAESANDTMKSVYSGRYGSDVANVMSYINSCKARGEELDYEVFIDKYNAFLSKIEAPWKGSYKISLIFFSISIPKEWFKGEFSGDRYLEDERYALFVNLAELEEIRAEKESAEEELLSSINDGYDTLAASKSAYTQAVGYLSDAEDSYEEALQDNMAGLVEYTELYDKKIGLMEQQKSIYEMRTDYAKSISEFNLLTSGFISDIIFGTDNSALKDYEDGISTGDMVDSNTPSWYVDTHGSDYKCEFGVKIPSSYGVTHYELYTEDDLQIGARTKINGKLKGINVIYSDSSLLKLKFYANNELKYIAVFDGMQYFGTLDMQSVDGGTEQLSAGKWSISNRGIKSTFRVTSDMFDFDSFEVYYKEQLVGKGTAASGFSHLSSTFGDLSDFSVVLYYAGAEMARLEVIKTGSGEQLLVY